MIISSIVPTYKPLLSILMICPGSYVKLLFLTISTLKILILILLYVE
jgi:hypothetical protein